MLAKERENLAKAADERACISIAISEDGTPFRGCFVPWERTVSAMNMKLPNITLAADDLQDASVMEDLGKCEVIGCYLFTALEDYQFLCEFTEIMDLFILKGKYMRDLSFVKNMPHLFLFYLEEAVLPDLEPLVEICNQGDKLPGKCLGFYRCQVKDTSALSKVDFLLSELLVWPTESDTRERWKAARAPGIFRFFENDDGK